MQSRGFTLIEALVVMTISAILIAVAVPSFQWTIARNRISDATNSILSNLEYARMEATRRQNTVSMCRVVDPNATPPVCSSTAVGTFDGNDWAAGWVVFEKIPPNINAAAVQGGDQVIFRQQSAPGSGSRAMIHTNIPGGERVAFQPRGVGGITGAGTFAITHGTPLAPAVDTRVFGTIPLTQAGRCIPVAPIGAMRIAKPGTGPCPAA